MFNDKLIRIRQRSSSARSSGGEWRRHVAGDANAAGRRRKREREGAGERADAHHQVRWQIRPRGVHDHYEEREHQCGYRRAGKELGIQ